MRFSKLRERIRSGWDSCSLRLKKEAFQVVDTFTRKETSREPYRVSFSSWYLLRVWSAEDSKACEYLRFGRMFSSKIQIIFTTLIIEGRSRNSDPGLNPAFPPWKIDAGALPRENINRLTFEIKNATALRPEMSKNLSTARNEREKCRVSTKSWLDRTKRNLWGFFLLDKILVLKVSKRWDQCVNFFTFVYSSARTVFSGCFLKLNEGRLPTRDRDVTAWI